MNDNRMDPRTRSRYWTRNVAVPAGAVAYMTVAGAQWMVLAFVVMTCGMLQFIYSENPVYVRLSMPVFVILLAAAGIAALFDVVASALITGGLLLWRASDFRRTNNSRSLRELLKSDRGQVYAAMLLLFITGVGLTLVRYYIPLHAG